MQFLPQSMQPADKMWTIKLHYKWKVGFPSQENIPSHKVVMNAHLHHSGCTVLSGLLLWTFLWASVNPWPSFCVAVWVSSRGKLVQWSLATSASTSWKRIPNRFCHMCCRWGLQIGSLFTFSIFAPWMWSGSSKKLVKEKKQGCWQHSSNRVLKPQVGN